MKPKKNLLTLNNKKASREGNIPVNILKDATDTYLPTPQSNRMNFEMNWDWLMFSPFTKKDPNNKENYRPVSLLSHMSKVFERLLQKHIETFMNNKLSIKLFGSRKNYNTQYCLTFILEKWKNILEKGKYFGAVFVDFSKAFDTINHDLLIAKLEAYGFSNNALLFMLSYLKSRSQRVSINSSFSTW